MRASAGAARVQGWHSAAANQWVYWARTAPSPSTNLKVVPFSWNTEKVHRSPHPSRVAFPFVSLPACLNTNSAQESPGGCELRPSDVLPGFSSHTHHLTLFSPEPAPNHRDPLSQTRLLPRTVSLLRGSLLPGRHAPCLPANTPALTPKTRVAGRPPSPFGDLREDGDSLRGGVSLASAGRRVGCGPCLPYRVGADYGLRVSRPAAVGGGRAGLMSRG